MLKILFPLFLLTVQCSFAQVLDPVFVESPETVKERPPLPEDPNEIPPLNHLNPIDTIREGLYRSTLGVNPGYSSSDFLYGVFDNEKMIIPFEYCYLSPGYSHFMIAKKFGVGTGAIDSLNQVIIPFEYSGIYPIDPNIPLHENKYFKAYKGKKKAGLINQKGEVMIPLEYAKVQALQNSKDVFLIEDHQQKYGIANLSQSVLSDCKYSGGITYLNHLFLKTVDRKVIANSVSRKHGSINYLGEEIVPPIYQSLTLSLDGKYLIAYDGLHSKLFDQTGTIVFQKDSIEIKNLVLGIYTWFAKGKSVILQKDFTEILPIDGFADKLSPRFYSIKSSLKKKGNAFGPRLFGVNDYLGQAILPIQFSKVVYAQEGLLFARANASPLYAAYDEQGNEVIPPSYSFVETSAEQAFAIVAQPDSDKFALLDAKGQAITPFIYDNIYFSSPRSNQPFQIIGERENKRFRILPDGKEAEKIIGLVSKNKSKINSRQKDSIATESLQGNYHTFLSRQQDSILIQYQFTGGGKGQRIIFYSDKKGAAQKIIQNFHLRISGAYSSGALPWLWLWLEEPAIANKTIANFFKANKIDRNREDFPIQVKYPYTAPKVLELIESQ